MINIKNNKFIVFFICIFLIIGDQYTKYLIENNYNYWINKNLIIFSIDYVKNYGAAFNLFEGSRIFLSLLSIIITIILIYLILNNKYKTKLELLSYNFILAGSIGNGLDRLIKGYVVDFINLNFINFPIFNIADISINIGFFLILYLLLKNRKQK